MNSFYRSALAALLLALPLTPALAQGQPKPVHAVSTLEASPKGLNQKTEAVIQRQLATIDAELTARLTPAAAPQASVALRADTPPSRAASRQQIARFSAAQ